VGYTVKTGPEGTCDQLGGKGVGGCASLAALKGVKIENRALLPWGGGGGGGGRTTGMAKRSTLILTTEEEELRTSHIKFSLRTRRELSMPGVATCWKRLFQVERGSGAVGSLVKRNKRGSCSNCRSKQGGLLCDASIPHILNGQTSKRTAKGCRGREKSMCRALVSWEGTSARKPFRICLVAQGQTAAKTSS